MSLKLFNVFVTNQAKPSVEYILHKLGLGHLQERKTIHKPSFFGYPDALYVGKYQDTLIFKDMDLPFMFFSPELNEQESKFIELFPNSEICSVYLASGQNYAYSLIQNGNKIRCKSNQKEYIDMGEYLPEELALQNENTISPKELEEMTLCNSPEKIEKYKQDEIGYRTAIALTARYVGKAVDRQDTSILPIRWKKFV